MPSDSGKKIRSIKDNPAGKVVADDGGRNRWQWDSDDPTSLLLKKLNNDELALEQTGVQRSRDEEAPPGPALDKQRTRDSTAKVKRDKPATRGEKARGGHDAGGGFNPYDSSGKGRKR